MKWRASAEGVALARHLHDAEGLVQIAERLGRSAPTVKTRMAARL
jgi:hypothetical protein